MSLRLPTYDWLRPRATSLCLYGLALFPTLAWSQKVDQRLWGVDPGVTLTAAAVSGNTLYVGGSFVSAAPVVGGGVITDPQTGALRTNSPRIAGSVNACIPDGHGGWYIGGDFRGVGGLPRANLAHVFASGRVDAWAPDPDGQVFALALSGSTLYVGGAFSMIGGEHRDFAGAVDITTGTVSAWNPHVQYGWVLAILALHDRVYLGGSFIYVGGELRLNIASVDASDGRVTAWNPNPDPTGTVRALVALDDTIFAAGDFVEFSGTLRLGIAAFDAKSGQLADWDAHLGHEPDNKVIGSTIVFTILVKEGRLYIGGIFNRVGRAVRPALAELNPRTGEATEWDPHIGLPFPDSVPYATGLALRGTALYVAGAFDSLGAQRASYGGAVDTRTGLRLPWNPLPNSYMGALALSGDALYVGGVFTSVGPTVPRHGLAAFDLRTGTVTPWDPYPDGQPFAIVPHDGRVYVGGSFQMIGGQTRPGIAALDSITGRASEWDPQCGGSVWAIAFGESTAYVGGSYDRIGGQERHYLSEIDLRTGLATGWNPGPNNPVKCLVARRDVIYAGGWFDAIGAGGHGFLAALDPVTGLATSWDPHADALVNCLAVEDTTIYVGGHITSLGGQRRLGFGVVGAAGGAALPMTADLNGEARRIIVRDGAVYVGGSFTRIGGVPRNCLAAVESVTGRVLDWNPDPDGAVWDMAGDDHRVYPVGEFARMGTSAVSLMAAVSMATTSSAPGPPPGHSVLLALDVTSPCRDAGIVHFALRAASTVDLEVFDMQGRRMATLLDHVARAAGDHEIPIATSDWPAGCYFWRLRGGSDSATRKMLVVP